jgi:holin (3TMs family)
MALDPITAGLDLANTVVAKLFPDKSAQEQAQLAAAVALVQGQLDINRTEAANPSVFVAGWRPSIGWVCSFALAWQFIARPALGFIFAALGKPLPTLPGIDDQLWQLLSGMLGLGALRTFEKVKGVAS